MQRAYSILHVKSIDGDRRVLTGIATTPTPDRVGDVVEPLGVTYKNPLPLLLFHDSQKPVGVVHFTKVTSKGVEFEATIPEIAEPGTLKDRADEAWQSVKYKLIGGVSIGFRILKDGYEAMKDGGYRFTKTEVLELSLVPIPANADAVIATVKSLDAASRAASGTHDDGPPHHTSGASDIRVVKARQDMKMKTIAEQKTAFEATRQAKSARMAEIMNKSGEEGVTLDAAQTEEYDGLEAEVKSIDEHLVRLDSLDAANKAAAKRVDGTSPAAGSDSRGGRTVTVGKDNLPAGIEFARYAMCLASSNGNRSEALEIAKARFPDQVRIQTVLKAAVAGGTTTDATWAGSLVDYTNFAGDFIEFLRPQTIIGKFGMNGVPSLRRVPFNVKIQGQTSGGTGYWVGQGASKPVTKFDFAGVTLTWAKVAAISVLTEELVRFSSPSAEALVRDALAAALIERIDIDFIDPAKAAVANISPASITNGITALQSTGTDLNDIRYDIQRLFGTFITANNAPQQGVWIMSATTALALSLMTNPLGQREYPDITMMGGRFMGLPVIVSQYVADGSPTGSIVILANASDIYLADDGQVVVDVSREASLQMDSAPTANSATGTGASMVSLWQTNSIGLRAERFINWQRRRSSAVAYLDNVQWSSVGSPA